MRGIKIEEDTSGWEQTFEYPESEFVDINEGWHSQQPYPIDSEGRFIEGSVPDPDFGKKKPVEHKEDEVQVECVELKLEFK